MKNFIVAAAVIAASVLPASASAQSCSDVEGNLVKNCSFENPTGQPGAQYPNAPLDDWTANPVGVVERWTSAFGGFAAKDGNTHVELKVDQSTTLWQYIETVAGTTYTLKYSAGHRANGDHTSQIDVYFGSTLGGGTMISSTGATLVDGFVWYDFEATFDALSDGGYLEFRSMGTHPTYGDHLDNVSVAGPSSPATVVPEPSTYAMLAMGLAGMFAVRRRRSA